MDKDAFLRNEGFPEWVDVTGRASVVDDYLPRERYGIYVLRFENNHYYVGRSVDVADRFRDHSQKWTDLKAITFQAFPEQDLSVLEKEYIRLLRREGFELRNAPDNSDIKATLDVTARLSAAQLEAWVGGYLEVQDSERRTPHPWLVVPDYHKMKLFNSLPYAQEALALLHLYLLRAFPLPNRTELISWTVTCLPKDNNNLPGVVTYLRVNIRGQEVFSVQGDAEGVSCLIYMAVSPLVERFGEDWKRWVEVGENFVTGWTHIPGGKDQTGVEVGSVRALKALLDSSVTWDAVAHLNARLMVLGNHRMMWRGAHSPGLVEAALYPTPPVLELVNRAVDGTSGIQATEPLDQLPEGAPTILLDGEVGALQHHNLSSQGRLRLQSVLSLMLSLLPALQGRGLNDNGVAQALSTLLMHAEVRSLTRRGEPLLGHGATTLAGGLAGPGARWGLVNHKGRMLTAAVALAIRDEVPIPEAPDLSALNPATVTLLTEVISELSLQPLPELRDTPAYRGAFSRATFDQPGIFTLLDLLPEDFDESTLTVPDGDRTLEYDWERTADRT
ncbi:GIY-YIG nuclease family protein [Deinococcus hopiensis]|uniref:GIY-YIG catalytic domain-containing protein n=1 Tax=Deinococcus hopiensis KR-140 TaxID=695939 RepID=A0A1W1UKQ3_9DEIO|nr:GIY-YIG nuclease family protein [Deinococcus hopiensis]SMB81324.1 GIY-YIG catalytic domain-containing protein [Deinococcus hopiensis KR-140]